MQIQALSQDFVARVVGLDFTQEVNEQAKSKLNEWFARYAVLVFPKQKLTPPEFMRAVEVFGELMPQWLPLPDSPSHRVRLSPPSTRRSIRPDKSTLSTYLLPLPATILCS